MKKYQVVGIGNAIVDVLAQTEETFLDHMGIRKWSEIFQSRDVSVVFPQGAALVHVVRVGADLEGARVYLFTGSGSYLGRHETTDPGGMTTFILPGGLPIGIFRILYHLVAVALGIFVAVNRLR